jgi:hypothetical protein
MMKTTILSILAILAIAVLTGCGVTELTSDGETVRQISANRAADCESLGLYNIEFDWTNDDATDVISRDYYVRNSVAQAGADAFRVTDDTRRTESTRKIELYDCANTGLKG